MSIEPLNASRDDLEVFLSQQVKQTMNYVKYIHTHCKKLAKASMSPELHKALSPASTFIEDHLKRLKLINKTILKSKVLQPSASESIMVLSFQLSKVKRSATQDLHIVNSARQLFAFETSALEYQLLIAKILKEDTIIMLLEQSISENHDSITWLNRIVQNVILAKLND